MGLILDSSLLIAEERGKFDMARFLGEFLDEQVAISAITASELLHGVERAQDPQRKARREAHVQQVINSLVVVPFDLEQAKVHARIWAELAAKGQMIGPHDLQIAASCVALGYRLGTLNVDEFARVAGLEVVDGAGFRIS